MPRKEKSEYCILMSNVRLRPECISPAPEFPGSPTRSRKSRPLSRICKQKPFPELKKQRRDIFVTPAIYLASGERGRSVDSEARVTLSTPDHWQITVSVAPPSSVAPGGPCPRLLLSRDRWNTRPARDLSQTNISRVHENIGFRDWCPYYIRSFNNIMLPRRLNSLT